ncbi:hypothetical protein ACYULU_09870 [Breznakiellaceae bacterium SP9]
MILQGSQKYVNHRVARITSRTPIAGSLAVYPALQTQLDCPMVVVVAPVPQALSTPLVQYLPLVHVPTPEPNLDPQQGYKEEFNHKVHQEHTRQASAGEGANRRFEEKKLLPFVSFVPLVLDFSSFLFCGSRLAK